MNKKDPKHINPASAGFFYGNMDDADSTDVKRYYVPGYCSAIELRCVAHLY
jgi:hypothetical protein